MIKIATWNVNSVRMRLPHIEEWIQTHNPDILLLQEIKCEENAFPKEALEDKGYNICLLGQKTFNGVAILSKAPLEDVVYGLPTWNGQDGEIPQSRYIEAFTMGIRVASVYVPNGESPQSPKFSYKMRFLNALHAHMHQLLSYEEKCVIGGDFNIAPYAHDIYDPIAFKDSVLFTQEEREHFYALQNLGYVDAIRLFHKTPDLFTWWDYRNQAFAKNKGGRIDHLLISPKGVDYLENAGVDPTPRGMDKASDHAPVWCLLRKES